MTEYLGHYTTLDKLELILETMQLKFGNFADTNDPFENKETHVTINPPDKTSWVDQIITNDTKKDFHLICSSIDNSSFNLINKPRMWSQYANEHKGCCIIFEKNIIDTKFKELEIQKENKYKDIINYNQKEYSTIEIKQNTAEECRTHVRNNLSSEIWKQKEKYLFCKHKDWETENEFRYVIFQRQKQKLSINITEAIHEIYLGEKVSRLYASFIYTWLKSKGINSYKIKWRNGHPTINDCKNIAISDISCKNIKQQLSKLIENLNPLLDKN